MRASEGAGTLLGASMLSMVDSVLTGTLAGPACDGACDMYVHACDRACDMSSCDRACDMYVHARDRACDMCVHACDDRYAHACDGHVTCTYMHVCTCM